MNRCVYSEYCYILQKYIVQPVCVLSFATMVKLPVLEPSTLPVNVDVSDASLIRPCSS